MSTDPLFLFQSIGRTYIRNEVTNILSKVVYKKNSGNTKTKNLFNIIVIYLHLIKFSNFFGFSIIRLVHFDAVFDGASTGLGAETL